MSEKYYDLQWELRRATETRGVADAIKSVIAETPVADWDALIAEGGAAILTAERAAAASVTATTALHEKRDALNRTVNSLRTIGKTRFKETHPDIAKQFSNIPSNGTTSSQTLARAQAAVAAWETVPDPDTWKPLNDLTLASLQTMITEFSAAVQKDADQKKLARTAALELQATAKKIHQQNISWYAEATATFSRDSQEGQLIRGIQTDPPTHTTKPDPSPTPTPAS